MQDENILQRSINSVTDEKYYKKHEEGSSEDSSQNYYSVKKQMIRYLSRVADKNKPMFLFNQKLNLGGDSDDDSDTGTPSFSLVALIREKWKYYALNLNCNYIKLKAIFEFIGTVWMIIHTWFVVARKHLQMTSRQTSFAAYTKLNELKDFWVKNLSIL